MGGPTWHNRCQVEQDGKDTVYSADIVVAAGSYNKYFTPFGKPAHNYIAYTVDREIFAVKIFSSKTITDEN